MIAYCFMCEKKVSVSPANLIEADFWAAIESGPEVDVEVMHLTAGPDHKWKLNKQEKENLRNAKARGAF